MKVITDETDRYGEYPIKFIGKNLKLSEIHKWLFNHFQGYKFAIIINEMPDEYEDQFINEVYVYFLDTIKKEVDAYCS